VADAAADTGDLGSSDTDHPVAGAIGTRGD
jgi:hypothetical protein